MNSKETSARNKVILAMFIYGTIGVTVKTIGLPSAIIAMMRGTIGAPFLLLIMMLFKKQKPDFGAIRKNARFLIPSGTLLGINWMLLFSSYNYTSVATATLCYYFAPIILTAISPFLFHEKMTVKKIVCILVAIFGMYFVSGVAENGIPDFSEIRGVLLALTAAFFYAAIVSLNKNIVDISPYDKTFVQLAISALVMLPYNLLLGNFTGLHASSSGLILLVVLGVVHTGFAYLLYFGSTADLPAQTLAILSYIDPVIAVILSSVVLRERLSVYSVIGAVLILGAAVVSELKPKEGVKNG